MSYCLESSRRWFEFSWKSAIEDYHFGLELLCLLYFVRLVLGLWYLGACFGVTPGLVVAQSILAHTLTQPFCLHLLLLLDILLASSARCRVTQWSTHKLPRISRRWQYFSCSDGVSVSPLQSIRRLTKGSVLHLLLPFNWFDWLGFRPNNTWILLSPVTPLQHLSRGLLLLANSNMLILL